jgi:hypothetical protein
VYDHLFQLSLGGGSLNNLLVDGSTRHQPATQCELYYSKTTVLPIRDVYPGSRILIIIHPGPQIPDLGSRFSNPKTTAKEEGKFFFIFFLPFFCSHKYHKIENNFYFWTGKDIY